ncbi:MAG: UUP1 family membrane protein [candidate division Zixibacteria bacterium]|nr:UUP1 family membrane protein [candidate division Zixibacteria bacterium]
MSVRITQGSRILIGLLPALLVLGASALAYYKIAYLGYNLDAVIQSESYYLETVMEFDGHGSPVEISMALPGDHPNQAVSDEAFNSDEMKFNVATSGGNRRGIWTSPSLDGRQRISYIATVVTRAERFAIDSAASTRQTVPDTIAGYLLSDTAVQCDSPEVAHLADSLNLSPDSSFLYNARRMFQHVTHDLKYVQYSGQTDALTAYRLGEASCGGKSRLLAALARHLGIPARLVGGKILTSGESRATHIWVEMYLNGYWIDFCPTNNYFGEIPSHYLVLYYGELPFISHTKDINFKFYFNLKKRLQSTQTGLTNLKEHPLDALNIWSTFKRVSISLELLKIIIMLPVGVLVVVVCRNLIGIETFGTFMPTLIAIGFRDTGLINGVLLFALVIAFGSVIRSLFARLHLLHTPRLAIILSFVVMFILGLTATGVQLGFLDLARVALFPMVILTLTVERFSLIIEETSLRNAIRVSVLTMLVSTASYALMESRLMQAVVISFPETILLVVALYIYIGRYSGFRVTEYVRFKHLLAR